MMMCCQSKELTYKFQSRIPIDRVVTKAVSERSHFKPVINKHLRSLTMAKLWRMGKSLAKLSSRQWKR